MLKMRSTSHRTKTCFKSLRKMLTLISFVHFVQDHKAIAKKIIFYNDYRIVYRFGNFQVMLNLQFIFSRNGGQFAGEHLTQLVKSFRFEQ